MRLSRCSGNSHAGFVQIQVAKSFLLLAGTLFLLLALGIGLAGFWAGRHWPTVPQPGEAPHAAVLSSDSPTTYAAKPGPWGQLECQRSFLEVPEEYLGTRSFEVERPRWCFKGYSPERLCQLLGSAHLPDAIEANLMDRSHWQTLPEGIWLSPSTETILSLPSAARQQIYSVLAEFEENALLNQPFHWPADAAVAWFSGAEISAQTQALFRRLCYQRGNELLFSDPATLLAALPNQAEKNGVAKMLMRRPVVFASLKVSPQSDLESLIKYWGTGGLEKDLRPLLEAAAKVPGGRKISISALLPPRVRARLYTFPFLTPEKHLNCHWTAFNFFKPNPDPPTEDAAVWKRKLDADYSRVTGQPRYGDLLVLAKPDGRMIHSCVYLADELVYTKNGASPLAPWQLSTIPDVLAFYAWDLPENSALRVAYFRARNP